MPRLRVAPSTALSAAGAFAAVLALAAFASTAAARTAGAARPAAATRTAASGAAEKTIAELRGLEDRFNKAYEANDLKAYFDFYSDDMTQLYQQGRLDLPDYRALWEKEIAGGGGMVEVKTADMVFHVGPSNDSAVAAYRIFTKQRHPDGTTTASWNQETDVLFKRSGRWKVVHVHYSDAPKAN